MRKETKLGVIRYDSYGRPICEICGRGYHKLLSHVRKHGVTPEEYKKTYGLDKYKSIMSKKSKESYRKAFHRNRAELLPKLIENGRSTRLKKGHKKRTKSNLSEQSRLRLQKSTKKINDRRKRISRKSGGTSQKGDDKS